MRALTVLLVPMVALTLASPADGSEPALSLHFGPTTYPGCAALSADTLTCNSIVVEGSPAQIQRVYVLLSGVDVAHAVQFGVTYPPGVNVLYWQACGGGVLAIPETGWPATGSGIALAWADGLISAGADTLAVVGYLEIGAGSAGVVSLTADPRSGNASYVDPNEATHAIPGTHLGSADVGGAGGGVNACEQPGWAGGFGFPELGGGCNDDLFILSTPFAGFENDWDCGASSISGESIVDTIMERSGDEQVQDLVVRNRADRVIPEEPSILTLATAGADRFHTSENEADLLESIWIGEIEEPLATLDLHPRRRLMALGQTGPEGEDVILVVGEALGASGQEIYVARVTRSDAEPLWERRYVHLTVTGDHYVGGIEIHGDFAYIGASVENSTESRLFALRIDVSNGNESWNDVGISYPVSGVSLRATDVVLDFPNGFYVAGKPSPVVSGRFSPSVVVGFSETDGAATYCRTFGTEDAEAVLIEALEVDVLGDIYVAGRLNHPDLAGGPCLFVARDQRHGVGSSYFSVLNGSCSQSLEFGDLLVTDGGAAYVLDPHSKRVWRTDLDGSTRWTTAFPCNGQVELLEYSARRTGPLAGVLLVAGSFLTTDVAVCDERPCTYLFALDHHDGDILGSYAVNLRMDADVLVSEPGAIALDDVGIWIASEVFDPELPTPTRDILLSRFFVDAATVEVSSFVPSNDRADRLRVWGVGSHVMVDLAEFEQASIVRLYDVAGRLVAFDEPRRGRKLVRFRGLPPGLFFVEAVGRSARAVAKVVVAP